MDSEPVRHVLDGEWEENRTRNTPHRPRATWGVAKGGCRQRAVGSWASRREGGEGSKEVAGEACSSPRGQAWGHQMEGAGEGWYQTGAAGEGCSHRRAQAWKHQGVWAQVHRRGASGEPCLRAPAWETETEVTEVGWYQSGAAGEGWYRSVGSRLEEAGG